MTRPRCQRGFSIVEAAVAVLLTGVTLAATFAIMAPIAHARQVGLSRIRGGMLAEDLMAEILAQVYEGPGEGRGSFGLSTSESATGDRSLFDDIDDYDGWVAKPPQRKDGSPMAGLDRWSRSVDVQWIKAVGEIGGSDTRIKQITVTVRYNSTVVATAVAVRTGAWDEMHGRGEP